MSKREIILEYRTKIRECKQKLKATDYKALKFAEGELTSNEYASTLIERREARAQINYLEAKIKELKGK